MPAPGCRRSTGDDGGIVPSITLMLIGGAVADSKGPRLIMVISDAAMCLATAVLLIAIILFGTPVWLLFSAGVLVGMSNAFYMPSSGTIPRRLVGQPGLVQLGLGLLPVLIRDRGFRMPGGPDVVET